MAYETLVPWPGIEPAPPALEGRILTTGPPEESLSSRSDVMVPIYSLISWSGFVVCCTPW